MKKFKAIMLCAALISLAGCANTTTSRESSNTTTQEAPAATAEITAETIDTKETAEASSAAAVGDTVSLGGFDITVNSFEFLSKISQSEYLSFKPDDGNVYLSISMSVKNTASEAQTFAPSFSMSKNSIKAIYDGSYEFSGTNLLGYSEDIHDSHINPLSSVNGVYVFSVASEIENSDKSLQLKITIDGETITYSLR